MQLDQTRIAIRERSFGEILGLALQVTRARALAIFGLWLLGALPFAVLNAWLLYDVLVDELWYDVPSGYWMVLLWLMALEAPFATAPVTIYLGKMMFGSEIRFGNILADLFRSLPQLVLFQGLLRFCLLPIFCLPYWLMPYTGELILLERNPLFAGKHRRMTTGRRSRNLHRNSGGELFGRWLLACLAGGLLVMAMGMGIETLTAQLGSVEVTPTIRHLVVYPTAAWLVFGWMAVVRFLAYLDLRIRREGWEVELLLRAEAQRLRRHVAPVSG